MHIPPFSRALLRQLILLCLIVGLGVLIFWHINNFIPALLGAYTLYILLGGWVQKLENKGLPRWVAILLVMAGSFLTLLLPLYFVGQVLFNSHALALDQYATFFDTLKGYITQLESRYHFNILDEKSLDKVSSWLAQMASQLVNGTLNGITGILLSYLMLYFMLKEREKLEAFLRSIFPLSDTNAGYLLQELNKLVFSNAIGIPVIGLVQGTAGLIIYLILGVPNPWLWFLVTCVVSMIPILGSALAYIPVAILLVSNDQVIRGVIMLLYGFFVIGSVDNIFRIWLQNKLGDTHPLITLFGVIIGAQLWGFMGLIFGPILLSIFLLLWQLYAKEYPLDERQV